MSLKIYKTVFKKDNLEGYNRWFEFIMCEPVKCDVCNKNTLCLNMDGSDGEYNNGVICESCVVELFKNYKLEQEKLKNESENLNKS